MMMESWTLNLKTSFSSRHLTHMLSLSIFERLSKSTDLKGKIILRFLTLFDLSCLNLSHLETLFLSMAFKIRSLMSMNRYFDLRLLLFPRNNLLLSKQKLNPSAIMSQMPSFATFKMIFQIFCGNWSRFNFWIFRISLEHKILIRFWD